MPTASEQLLAIFDTLRDERRIKPTCEAAGVPRTTLNRWASGEGGLTLSQAEALAKAIGMEIVVRDDDLNVSMR